MNTGWECPKCGRCYSPAVLECKSCNRAPIVPADMTGTLKPGWTLDPGPSCNPAVTVKGPPYQERPRP